METIAIGVIGGSGLYDMPEITDKKTVAMETPFGPPSADVVIGTLRGRRVAFLPRHGVGHIHTPTTVPYRANIYALKSLGVRHIIAVNACGSLRGDYTPGHIIIPDQLLDYTNSRERSFFDAGLVAHVSVAEPFCAELSGQLVNAVRSAGGTVHDGGTFLIEEGPRFATRAESHLFRAWGCDIIGMTTCPEAFLAREAEIAYATMAHVTDYDVWHTGEKPVTVEMVVATFRRNIQIAQRAVAAAVETLDTAVSCACHTALDDAVLTSADAVPPHVRERLHVLLRRYWGRRSGDPV